MEKITSNLSQFDRSGDELSKQKSIIIRLLKLHLKIGDYNFWILYKLVYLLALLHLLHYYTYVCIIRIETRRGLREQSLFLILFLRIFVNLQQFPAVPFSNTFFENFCKPSAVPKSLKCAKR